MENIQKSILLQTEYELLSLNRNVHEPNAIENNLEYVKDLAQKQIPTQIIKEILDNNELLQTVATRSYEHVNHFDKIVLIDNKNPKGFRLTLHYWDGEYDSTVSKEELIHNHRFSFWSHVYQGTLISENFIETFTNSIERKTFNKYVYRPTITGNIHSCSYDRETQLMKLERTYVDKGDTYYLNYSTTHRIVFPQKGKNLCTFVLRGPREREYTNTYNTFYPDHGIESSVPMMTPVQLKNKLLKILGEK